MFAGPREDDCKFGTAKSPRTRKEHVKATAIGEAQSIK